MSRVFDVRRPAGRRITHNFSNRSQPFCEDTIFYSDGDNIDAEEVKRSLVNHDGYNSDIIVTERRK